PRYSASGQPGRQRRSEPRVSPGAPVRLRDAAQCAAAACALSLHLGGVTRRNSARPGRRSLNGLGPALAQNQDSSLNQLTNPALPEQYVILWGTGLGSARAGDATIQLGGRDIAP